MTNLTFALGVMWNSSKSYFMIPYFTEGASLMPCYFLYTFCLQLHWLENTCMKLLMKATQSYAGKVG